MAKNPTASDFQQINKEIKSGNFAPVYILMGDEDYFIDQTVENLESCVVLPDEKDFNSSVFYGADSEIKQVISSAQQYPVMAPRKIVLLKEAQTMYNAKKELDKLAIYIEHSNPTTVLVVTYKGDMLSSTSQLLKSVKKINGVILRSERPKDYQLGYFIEEYCKNKNINIDSKSINLLCDYIGSPLAKLYGEIDKLIVASDTHGITAELIENIIGISKDFNSFELVKAISVKDYSKAMRIIYYFTKNPKQNPAVIVVATLFSYFSKLFMASVNKDKTDEGLFDLLDIRSSYALTDYRNGLRNFTAGMIDSIIHHIRETDTKSKGVLSSQNEYELLKELIYKIFTVK